MDSRERNGLEMALTPRFVIEEDDRGLWTVPSQTHADKSYRVFYATESTCSCEDFRRHGGYCKHIWAVHYTLIRLDGGGELPELEDLPPAEPRAKTRPRNWPAIHDSRRNEKTKFQILLHDLCRNLKTAPVSSKGGRPRIPLADIVFGLAHRVYSKTPPAEQYMSDYEDLIEKGFVSTMISPNTLFLYMGHKWLTPILTALIEESAAPLAQFERGTFAADASGFSISRYRCWRVLREEEEKRRRKLTEKELQDWAKLTLLCGIETKVVASVKVTDGTANESPHLPHLAVSASKQFRLRRVLADGGFLSENNLKVIDEIGGVLFSPFKDNNVDDRGGIWKNMLAFFRWRHAEFMRYFSKRSIVECVFNMIKTKFRDSVTSRTDTAIKNEVLFKVLCHNLCRIIYVMYESGLEPEFYKGIDPS